MTELRTKVEKSYTILSSTGYSGRPVEMCMIEDTFCLMLNRRDVLGRKNGRSGFQVGALSATSSP